MWSTEIRTRGFAPALPFLLWLLVINVGLYGVLPEPGGAPSTPPRPLRAFRMEFDRPVAGRGWHDLERDLEGATFCWTADSPSTLVLPAMEADCDYTLEVALSDTVTPSHLARVRFTLNDSPLTIVCESRRGTKVFSGVLPRATFQGPRRGRLALWTIKAVSPAAAWGAADRRKLGVRVDWLRLVPRQGLRFLQAHDGPDDGWPIAGADLDEAEARPLALMVRTPAGSPCPTTRVNGTAVRIVPDSQEKGLWMGRIATAGPRRVALAEAQPLFRTPVWLYRPDHFHADAGSLPVGKGWSEAGSDERGETYRRCTLPVAPLRMQLALPAVVRIGVLTANAVIEPAFKPLDLYPPRPVALRLSADGRPVDLSERAGPTESVLQGLLPAALGGGLEGVELLFSTDAGRSTLGPAISWLEVEGTRRPR